MRLAVAVIAKAPVPGRVKTRLCPPCTPEEAAEIAEACLLDTLDAVRAVPGARHVVVLDGEAGSWLPEDVDVVPQSDGGLGDRLGAAFAAVGCPALVVGMDTPQVSAAGIADAASELLAPGTDAVIGGALDGGYWTIGLRRPCPGVFDGVPMSRPDTGARQRGRLAELGLSVAEVPPLRDIDDWADAVAVAGAHPGLRTARAVRDVRDRVHP